MGAEIMSGIVNCVSYEQGRRVGDVDLENACPADNEGCFVWIGLHEPDKDLLRKVQKRFGLHDLAIEEPRAVDLDAKHYAFFFLLPDLAQVLQRS